ncbi:MAG: hypothetical protein ACI88H_003237, partial [Cocleimonas sp.]
NAPIEIDRFNNQTINGQLSHYAIILFHPIKTAS